MNGLALAISNYEIETNTGGGIMTAWKERGATLGLIPCIILILFLIGYGLFYIVELVGGSKQLVNGTDSGALGAARQLLTVGLSKAEVSALPIEFQALGVDATGAPISIDPNSGAPNLNTAIFNVYAFNRAAGYTLLVALNAAEDGSPAAVSYANSLINALNKFGTELNTDLANASQLTNTFSTLAANNNINMLGLQSYIALGNGQLQFACVPGEGAGQANVYFNSNVYANDATLKNWIQQITTNNSVVSQINNRYNQNDPSAQAGQPFVFGYRPLDMSTITGVNGFTSKIFACAVNPSQIPHMIDSGRFNKPGTVPVCYAPSNSIAAQGQAASTNTGTNLLCTALAFAMLGAYDNQYPINVPYGWIRIQNGKDAIAANPGLSPVPLWASWGDNIFNIQESVQPGGKGGIWSSNVIYPNTGNRVFCTEAFDNEYSPFDTGWPGYSGQAEMNAWVVYNTTPCTSGCDQRGLNGSLDPSNPANNIFPGVSPSANLRSTGNFSQTASLSDMLKVKSIDNYCNSYMFTSNPPPDCANQIGWQICNYFAQPMPKNALDDYGTQPVGGLTNLEWVKGAIIGALDDLFTVTSGHNDPRFDNYEFKLNVGNNPSGSKLYDHSGQTGYATPATTPNVAFGTIGTPFQLIEQLGNNQPTGAATNCGDTSSGSSAWTDVSTPLGRLLQRCQMIVPSTTPNDVVNLLNTYKIDLNEYQYIYLPVGATKLVISNSPPPFLSQYPEFNSPGSTLPDGTNILSCRDASWDASGNGQTGLSLDGSLVNTDWKTWGNAFGDDHTSGRPFSSGSGNLSTWDGVTWTSNSGRFYFLGQLNFGNYISGNGQVTTFTQPN